MGEAKVKAPAGETAWHVKTSRDGERPKQAKTARGQPPPERAAGGQVEVKVGTEMATEERTTISRAEEMGTGW